MALLAGAMLLSGAVASAQGTREVPEQPRRDVLPQAPLELSPAERDIVYATSRYLVVPAELPAEPRVGAEVPVDVELENFPSGLVKRIAKLERYRFMVSDGQVIVVDPESRQIVVLLGGIRQY